MTGGESIYSLEVGTVNELDYKPYRYKPIRCYIFYLYSEMINIMKKPTHERRSSSGGRPIALPVNDTLPDSSVKGKDGKKKNIANKYGKKTQKKAVNVDESDEESFDCEYCHTAGYCNIVECEACCHCSCLDCAHISPKVQSMLQNCQTCEPIIALKCRLQAKSPTNTDLVLDVETRMLVLQTKIDGMFTKQDEVAKSYAQVVQQHTQYINNIPTTPTQHVTHQAVNKYP